MLKSKWWILVCLGILLGSCAQKLPYHESGYGVIAVPFEVSNITSYQLIRAIELKSTRDETFSLRLDAPPLNDDVVLSPPLAEGSYLIDYYVTRVVPVPGVNDGLRPQSIKLSTPVQVNLGDGEIFLFPLIFRAAQTTRADYIYCDFSHSALQPDRANYYRDKLSGMENGDMWKVKGE
mgnify:CR=1 FL=1